MTAPDLTASQEDYLEAIYHVVQENRVARSRDLVRRLGVNSSSVTQALHGLSERGMIHHEPYGAVTLTPDGERVALDVIRRHEALRYDAVRPGAWRIGDRLTDMDADGVPVWQGTR